MILARTWDLCPGAQSERLGSPATLLHSCFEFRIVPRKSFVRGNLRQRRLLAQPHKDQEIVHCQIPLHDWNGGRIAFTDGIQPLPQNRRNSHLR